MESDGKQEERPADLLTLIRSAMKGKEEVSYEPIHPKGTNFRAIPLLIVILLLFGMYLLFVFVEQSQPVQVAVDFLKNHPEIRTAVGDVQGWGIRPPLSYNASERHGNAEFALKLEGTKGETKAYVSLEKRAGRWTVVAASYAGAGGKKRPLPVVAKGTGDAGAPGKTGIDGGRLAVGIQHFQQNRIQEALAEFERAVEENPEKAVAYYWKGRSHARLKQFEKAAEDLRKSAKLDPRSANALNWLGWVELELQQWSKALSSFSKSLEIKPGQGWAHYQKGRCHYKLGDKNKALEEAGTSCRLGYQEGCRIYKEMGGR